ncbi:hypothetical protein [Niallia oryzisoli]|uniref:hypothetical protein n=1 Tax=Niallia oryzisoli TaxID=1737571 RepID=UPI0037354E55
MDIFIALTEYKWSKILGSSTVKSKNESELKKLRTNIKLQEAKELFWKISSMLNEIKLYVSETELGKNKAHDNAVTIYVPCDTSSAFGSIQYYGGQNLFNKSYVKNVELRFYFKFLKDKPELYSSVNQKNIFRVEDGKIYLKYQFTSKHSEREIIDFIDELTNKIQQALYVMYGLKYANLESVKLSERIKLLPKL